MDYFALSTLVDEESHDLVFTYDLGCQHSVYFRKRVQSYPERLQIDFSNLNIRYGIPKKHILVHGPNHSKYSLNYMPKVGRTYGEGIKAAWSHINPSTLAIQEMAPATRHEVLDCHWDAYNYEKEIGFGASSEAIY